MLKEIYEQKSVIHRSVQEYSRLGDRILDQMGLCRDDITRFSSLQIIACGSSWHAGLLAKFFFEEIAHLKTDVHIASEFRYARFWFDPTALYVAISQSGETADTLEALRMVKHAGGHTIALINVAMSTMVEESDGFLEIFAGPEIAVASTKAFSGQVTALYYLAHFFARIRGVIKTPSSLTPEQELYIAAQALEDGIEIYKDDIQQVLALRYKKYQKMLFVGRQESYIMAQEAALKLKEISYIFADALPAGELKHGSIALVEQETPIVLFSSLRPQVYQKLLLSAQEIKARPSHLVVYAFEGQQELIDVADHAFVLPRVAPLLGPLAQTGLMHYVAYEIARQLDRPIDKPRNLAKSVTVE